MNAPLNRDFPVGSNGAAGWRPGSIWSLWDMLRVFAHKYIDMGMRIHDAFAGLYFNDPDYERGKSGDPQTEEQKADLKRDMTAIREMCAQLGLSVSAQLLAEKIDDPPQTSREFQVL